MDISPYVRNFYFLNKEYILTKSYPVINTALLKKMNSYIKEIKIQLREDNSTVNIAEITDRDIIAFFTFFINERLLFNISRFKTKHYLSTNVTCNDNHSISEVILVKMYTIYFYLIITTNDSITLHNDNNKLLFEYTRALYFSIYKSYVNSLLSKETFLKFVQLVLYLCLYGVDNKSNLIENFVYLELYLKIINDLFMNNEIIPISEDNITLLTEVVKSFSKLILSNEKNIYLLNQNPSVLSDYMKLIFIIQKTNLDTNNNTLNAFVKEYKKSILTLFAYNFKYDNIMKLFIDITKHVLFDINTKSFNDFQHDLYLSNFPFEYLLSNMELYNTTFNNCNNIKQGINMNRFNDIDNSYTKCGIISYCINKPTLDAFQIVFSFCIKQSQIKNEQTLITLFGSSDNITWLKINFVPSDNKYLLKITIKENIIELNQNILIECDKDYFFSISCNINGVGEIKQLYNNEQVDQRSFTINKKGNEIKNKNTSNINKIICYIGCDHELKQCTFNGIIGRVILFSQLSNQKESNKTSAKQNNTENDCNNNIIETYFNNTNMNLNYLHLINHLSFPIHECKIELDISMNNFQFIKHNENNKCNNFILIKNSQVNFTSDITNNYKSFKNTFPSQQAVFNSNIHFINRTNPIQILYDCNGIDYLTMVLEYYYQILIRLPYYNNQINNIIQSEDLSKVTNSSISNEQTITLINNYIVPNILNVLNILEQLIKQCFLTQKEINKSDNTSLNQLFSQIFTLLFQILKPSDNNNIVLYTKCLHILNELSKENNDYIFSFYQQFFEEETFCTNNEFFILLFTSIKKWFDSFMKTKIPSVILDSIHFVESCFDCKMENENVLNTFADMLNSYLNLMYLYDDSNSKDNSTGSTFPYLVNKSLKYFHVQLKEAQNERRVLLINAFLNIFADEHFLNAFMKVDIDLFNEILSLVETEVLSGIHENKYNKNNIEKLILLIITIKLCQVGSKNDNPNICLRTYFINEFSSKYITEFKNENSNIFYILNVIEKLTTNVIFKGITFNLEMCSGIFSLMTYIQHMIEKTKENEMNQIITTIEANEYVNDIAKFYQAYNKIIKQMTIDDYYNIELADYIFSNGINEFVLFYKLNAKREEESNGNNGSFYRNLYQVLIHLINKQSNPFVFEFISSYYSQKDNTIPQSHDKWIMELMRDVLNYYFDVFLSNKQAFTNKFQIRNILNLLWMLYTYIMNASSAKNIFAYDINNKKQKQISFYLEKLIEIIKDNGFFHSRICINNHLLIEVLFDLLMKIIILCNKDSALSSNGNVYAKLIEQIFKFNKSDCILNTIHLHTIPKDLKLAFDKNGIENDLCVDCEKIYNVNYHIMFIVKLSMYYDLLKGEKGSKGKNFSDKFIVNWRKGLHSIIIDEEKKNKGLFIKRILDLVKDESLRKLLNDWITKWPVEKGVFDFTIKGELSNIITSSLNNLCKDIFITNITSLENIKDDHVNKNSSSHNNKSDEHETFLLKPPNQTYRFLLQNNISFQYGFTYSHSKSILPSKNPKIIEYDNDIIKDDTIHNTNITDIQIKNKNLKNSLILYGEINNIKSNDCITSPKRSLLKTTFALNFLDYYFHNNLFQLSKQIFISLYEINFISKQLPFPSKVKNFTNNYETHFFLNHDTSFFHNNKYLNVTHPFLVKMLSSLQHFPQIHFVTKPFIFNLYKEPSSLYLCEFISFNTTIKGKMYLKNEYFIFKSIPFEKGNTNKDIDLLFCSLENDVVNKYKVICIPLKEIKEIITKRYILMDQALEIKTKNGKSYFFNMYLIKNVTSFLNEINNELSLGKKVINIRTVFPKLKLNFKWKIGELTSYQYILLLNKFSSRSFNDINQYYIFPWLLKEYNNFNQIKIKSLTDDTNGGASNMNTNTQIKKGSKETSTDSGSTLQTNMSENIREFKYPICVQNAKNKERAKSKYEASQYNNVNPSKHNWFYHFGNHYSTSSYILYYKMRQNPFTSELVKLQSNAQENSNRMFISLSETQKVINNILDSRELIPEFFSTFEFMLNLNCSFFGYRIKGELVDDAILPDQETNTQDILAFSSGSIPSFNNYVDFIRRHRLMLDNPLLSDQLVLWFNSIFGEGQFYENENKNKASYNIYNLTSYEEKTNLNAKLQKYLSTKKYKEDEMILKIENKITQILNFGQTPIRLFKKAHIRKEKETISNDDDDFHQFGLQIQKMHRRNKKNKNSKSKENNNSFIYFLVDDDNTRCLLLSSDKSISVYDINDDDTKVDESLEGEGLLKQSEQVMEYKIEGSEYSTESDKEIKEMQKIKKPKEKPKNFFKEIFSTSQKELFTYICEIPPSNIKLFKYNNTQYQYSHKYSIIALYSFTHIITCRHKDNTLHINIITNNNDVHNVSLNIIQLSHFPYSICKLTETKFLCGLSTGQLLYFKHNSIQKDSYILTSSFYDHDSPIVTIDTNNRLNIIITSSLNGHIHIRKSYDFELISVIYFNNEKYIPLLISISNCNLVYVLYGDKEGDEEKKIIYGYTLNGLFFGKSDYGNYTGLNTNEDGDVFTGNGDKNYLCCIKGSFKPKMRRFGFMLFNYGNVDVKNIMKEEDLKRKMIWFIYKVKGKKRYLIYLDDLGTLQLINHYNLKKFDFFK